MIEDLQKVKHEIRKYILDNFLFGYREDELFNDTSFLKIGILDSVGIMELVTYLQREYKIMILDAEIVPENLDSIDCIANFLIKKIENSDG